MWVDVIAEAVAIVVEANEPLKELNVKNIKKLKTN